MAKQKKTNGWAIPFPIHNAPQPGAKPKSIFDELMDYTDADNMLIIGAAYGNGTIIKKALSKGADVNASNGIALRYAAEANMKDLVVELLAKGANPKADDSAALRWASAKGYLPIVEILHKAGADIHGFMDCALQWAMDSNKTKVVTYLKANKAALEPGYKEEHDQLKNDEKKEKKARMAYRIKDDPVPDPNDPNAQLATALGLPPSSLQGTTVTLVGPGGATVTIGGAPQPATANAAAVTVCTGCTAPTIGKCCSKTNAICNGPVAGTVPTQPTQQTNAATTQPGPMVSVTLPGGQVVQIPASAIPKQTP